ncbi:Kelch motif-containing protein [Lutibacter agarilyticus]|uniref:Kelch motif-containing protein n=1 Tax=Lutibacter agarilyticus TaxID=1109740 RepID=A0A238VVW4_9FLAO|nr:kelch repeat-containing protein [Lutibacter agarilyticus]SNR38277.1 Kelch motif-containing protein [Lutibacter agarilyticus]
MKKTTICILLIFLSINSYSQYIEGKIIDVATNKPIEGVHIYVDGVVDGTLSNSKGIYYLKVPSSNMEIGNIHFSHISYINAEVPFNKKEKVYNMSLNKNVTLLGEVSIVEKRNLKQTISFKKLKSMKSGLFSYGAVLRNNKIYVVGGNASYQIDGAKRALEKYEDTDLTLIEILQKSTGAYFLDIFKDDFLTYNILTNTWVKSEIEFDKRAYHNANLFDENLYVFGGTTMSINKKKEYLNTTIEIVNLKTNTKIVDETNPHQAVNFVSFNYQGNLIVAGGSVKKKRNGTKEYSNKVHFYDVKEGYWYELANMPSAKETNGVLIDDKIYLIGGFKSKPLSEIESFDLITKSWNKEGDLFFGIESPAVSANNEMIYIFDKGKFFTYNTKNKELNEFYIKLNLTSAKMYYSNNKIYLLGGINIGDYDTTPSSSLYSIDIAEFNKTQIRRTKTL